MPAGYMGIEKQDGVDMYSHIQKVVPLLPKGFFITHDAYAGPQIEEFIHQTEDIIDIKSKVKKELVLPLNPPVYDCLYDRSVFGMTNKRRVTWVEPSLFWMEKLYKKSLFVYLLFCGMEYARSKNYQVALESHQYTSQTRIAIRRFLFGFTQIPNDEERHWNDLFIGVEESRLKEMLVLPDYDESYESCIDAIWTP
jgi:hypothetical protein